MDEAPGPPQGAACSNGTEGSLSADLESGDLARAAAAGARECQCLSLSVLN